MSTQSGNALLSSTLIGAEGTSAPSSWTWLGAIGRFRESLRRHRQLRHLVELDDRLLADLGITREQALREARKHKWLSSPPMC